MVARLVEYTDLMTAEWMVALLAVSMVALLDAQKGAKGFVWVASKAAL